MLDEGATDVSSFAQEALNSAKLGKVSEVKNYLKTTEVNPEERSTLAKALIESRFSEVLSAQQLEEFVSFILQLHKDLPKNCSVKKKIFT